MLIGDMPAANALRAPDGLAVVDGVRRLDWKSFSARVNRLANALLTGSRLEKGDRVAIVARNRLEHLELNFATSASGLVYCGGDPRLAAAEVALLLHDAAPRVLLYSDEFADLAGLAGEEIGCELVALDREDGYEAMLQRSSALPPGVHLDPAALSNLCFTGGTTGRPKGVEITNAASMAYSRDIQITNRLGQAERYLFVRAMALAAGHRLPGVVGLQASTTVIHSRFEPEATLTAFESQGITTTLLAPTQMAMLVDAARRRPKRPRFPTLRQIYYGGSSITPQLLADCVELFDCEFIQCYGGTECGQILLLSVEDHQAALADPSSRRLGSVGREALTAIVRLVDDEGQEVEAGTPGEITVSSDQTMRGYWRQPELTGQALRDGRLHTGDVALRDEFGYHWLVGRKRDIIISGAYNIYPGEVEKALLDHPAVREVAVVGRPDPLWGEAVTAFVVREPGATVEASELVEFSRERIASYKKPRAIEFLDELPLTAGGKVDRGRLRGLELKGAPSVDHQDVAGDEGGAV
jgi:acyl-CoA synthetase (AMP-forming)/AMP-acid ligase II